MFLQGAKQSTVPANVYVALQKSLQQPLCDSSVPVRVPAAQNRSDFAFYFIFDSSWERLEFSESSTLKRFAAVLYEIYSTGANTFEDGHDKRGKKKIKIRAGAEQKRQEERSPLHLLLP